MTGTPVIGIVLKGYPRLSETFIAQELHGLEHRGARFHLYALRHPTDPVTHPIHERIRAPVTYLPEYLHDDPARVWRAARMARRMPGFSEAWRLFIRDLRREPQRDRVRRFGQALVLAADLDPRITHLHAHFLHTPASVTRYAAVMRGVPWSYSAHAKDIWTTPDWDKRDKLEAACFGVTCTGAGRDHLAALAPDQAPSLIHHGLDLGTLPAPPHRPSRDASNPQDPVRLVTVARAVEKKGLDTLLTALSRLPGHWHWTHIGGGTLLAALQNQAEALGLSARITWVGPTSRDHVFSALQDADLFVLPARVAADGDRDGIPNVLMEAMSQGLTCLATTAGAIPELISHGQTGWLVPPDDPAALAEALMTLTGDPASRQALGRAAARHIRDHFDASTGLDQLAQLLGLPPAHHKRTA